MHRPADDSDRGSETLTRLVPRDQWEVYAPLFAEGARRGITFAIGGGLAVSIYSEATRNTKDMDLFVREDESRALLEMIGDLGFEEYTEVPYDRTWSYRACKNGAIVDVLWKTLNGKYPVDERWLVGGLALTVRGTRVRMIPVEELIVSKLYVLKRERTDWPDILNLLHGRGDGLDWKHLLEVLGEDTPLLAGAVSIYGWLCPGRAGRLPGFLWEGLGLSPPARSEPQVDWSRVALISAGEWFGGGES